MTGEATRAPMARPAFQLKLREIAPEMEVVEEELEALETLEAA
jgi:hypothetical protein